MHSNKLQIGQNEISYEIYNTFYQLLENIDFLNYESYFLVYDPRVLNDGCTDQINKTNS